MRSLRRRALAMGACAAMMLAALVTATPSASASSSWQLVDEYTSHPVCYTTSGGTSNLAIDLNGSWSAPVNIGASALPAGVSAASTPVQANSSFNITLWASDGTTKQTETVPVVIQAPCKRHY